MTWKIALIFVSLASSLFLFALPGLGFIVLGISSSEARMIFYGWAFLTVGVVNLLCTGSLLRSEFNVSDRTIKAGFTASIAVGCFGLIASIEGESPVPFAVFLLLALLNAAPFYVAKRCRLPEGACETCGYDLAGLPSTVCPECGNETGKEKSPD